MTKEEEKPVETVVAGNKEENVVGVTDANHLLFESTKGEKDKNADPVGSNAGVETADNKQPPKTGETFDRPNNKS
ncbi:hypothetical protein H2200_009660 [Cladophialophora chaetospira]|uniref:Uncharacterized protein n=1 Tax=Cladophialophora chaetospira TaxID=386627 RepID=A0AA39CEZ5_9EURO|nr:hypothetical protein H2200_009660 [Cladophialophora chaetospira]